MGKYCDVLLFLIVTEAALNNVSVLLRSSMSRKSNSLQSTTACPSLCTTRNHVSNPPRGCQNKREDLGECAERNVQRGGWEGESFTAGRLSRLKKDSKVTFHVTWSGWTVPSVWCEVEEVDINKDKESPKKKMHLLIYLFRLNLCRHLLLFLDGYLVRWSVHRCKTH